MVYISSPKEKGLELSKLATTKTDCSMHFHIGRGCCVRTQRREHAAQSFTCVCLR